MLEDVKTTSPVLTLSRPNLITGREWDRKQDVLELLDIFELLILNF